MGVEQGSPLIPLESSGERVELRFPEIYQSPEWRELPKLDRAQLVLVAEGVKPGTIISGNVTSFQKIVEQMGLATRRNTESWDLDPVYEVASPEVLSERYRELVALPEEASPDALHQLNGKFLGYPECCTEEYVNPSGQREVSKFEYEATQLIAEDKMYPEELDYRPPAYTPCSATCSHALAALKTWKQLLEQADPEAAQRLQRFNWQSEPFRSVHREMIDEEEAAELIEEKKRFLRKSAGLEE